MIANSIILGPVTLTASSSARIAQMKLNMIIVNVRSRALSDTFRLPEVRGGCSRMLPASLPGRRQTALKRGDYKWVPVNPNVDYPNFR